ncbi:unnamed protein product [Ostreobium quekettii]|uniref:Uncharacterized protein n=1 Tax=Ostreobium quekettii TaxID=121088 RepID=A0A8S1JIB8_9CHLO|nr:unnamed protein product [Ostreobium quekettii]
MDHTLPKTAAAFILAENGPTLTLEGTYSIPPGAGDEPAEEEEAPPDDQPPMPASPYYEGLGFACRTGCPFPSTDVPFPPIDAPKPPPISPAPE